MRARKSLGWQSTTQAGEDLGGGESVAGRKTRPIDGIGLSRALRTSRVHLRGMSSGHEGKMVYTHNFMMPPERRSRSRRELEGVVRGLEPRASYRYTIMKNVLAVTSPRRTQFIAS